MEDTLPKKWRVGHFFQTKKKEVWTEPSFELDDFIGTVVKDEEGDSRLLGLERGQMSNGREYDIQFRLR